jgi:exosortase A
MKRDAIPFLGTSAAIGSTIAPRWRDALPPFVATLLLIIVAYASTAWAMVDTWYRSATFTHGFVVAPICAWLVYRRRGRLAGIDPRPAPLVLAFLPILGLAWLVGAFAGVNALSQFAFVGMIVLLVPAMLGREVAYEIAFPLAFLLFAVPVGDFLLPTLMERTANFTVWALRATGVPVYREGLLLVLPNGRWSIVEACSGVRYLIASLMVGTLYAYLNYRSYWRRAAFIVFAAAVPIVANWVRAYLIVMLGYLSNNQLAVGVDHLIYGWIFFGIVMLLMFWAGSRWQEPPAKPALVAQPAGSVTEHRPAARFWPVSIAAIGIAAMWPALDFATRIPPSSAPIALQVAAPVGWHAVSNETSFSPRFDEPSGEWRGAWERSGERVHLNIAYYRDQTPQRKLVGGANPLVRDDDTSWVRATSRVREVALGGADYRITETLLLGTGGRRMLVWQWYWIADGIVTASDALAKAHIGWLRLSRRRDDAAGIVLYADANDPRAARTLQRFVTDAWPGIEAGLRRAERR